MDIRVVGDVVAIVAQRRGIEGQEPEDAHAQVLEIAEFPRQPRKVADPIAVRVTEGAYVRLVDDPILVPSVRGTCYGARDVRCLLLSHGRASRHTRVRCESRACSSVLSRYEARGTRYESLRVSESSTAIPSGSATKAPAADLR